MRDRMTLGEAGTSAADPLAAARLAGTACAVATASHRDLRACVEAYPDLFAGKPFDTSLYMGVALANAFGSPGVDAKRLRIANRTALWIFAVDWIVDYLATSREEIAGHMAEWLAVADGRTPAAPSSAARMLAGIREELATSPAFPALRAVWREELRRMLAAMAREWEWKTARSAGTTTSPTLAEYLDNADNFGSTFVNVAHWIHQAEPAAIRAMEELRAASRKVQMVLRLLNDLATYERDASWGDLNVLMLGAGRDEIRQRIAELLAECRDLLSGLRESNPDEVSYLERQIGYSMGFYGMTDYWGAL